MENTKNLLVNETNVKLVNLTPHPVKVLMNNAFVELESVGICRVQYGELKIGQINGIELVRIEYPSIEGLPAPQENTYYIVSSVVALAMKGLRNDLIVPYDFIKDSTGNIIGCKKFQIF